MSSPVLTITPNILAETTCTYATPLEPGTTQRASQNTFQVGGKGFNVAKMLHRLGVPAQAISFADGPPGEACRHWLEHHALYAWELFDLSHSSRSGMVVRAPSGKETTFLGPDTVLDGTAAQSAAVFLQNLPASLRVALCGSVPGWSNRALTPLRRELEKLATAERLIVDSYGPALISLVEFPLPLVKINRTEFAALMQEVDLPPAAAAAQRRFPVHRWVITDGARPTEYTDVHESGHVSPPDVAEVSPTGSGDVFLATLLELQGKPGLPWRNALVQASRYAVLNAAHPDIAEFELPS
ncbi:MAG: hypothetical protein J6386_19335 [Candidatus Synoicihabitans palmerolidicus]|nr:hypothetical protein [Candidatus Synoicihabitans palmerolidicus]